MVSNFVCAGFETLSGIADRFIKSKNYYGQFTREDINRFFSNTCNKFLHSFGQNFRGKKNYKNYKILQIYPGSCPRTDGGSLLDEGRDPGRPTIGIGWGISNC